MAEEYDVCIVVGWEVMKSVTSQLEEMRGKKENYKRAALKEEERIKRLRISEV